MIRSACLRAMFCCLLFLLTLSGCSEQSKHINNISKKPYIEKRATWPEFENIGETNHGDVVTITRLSKMRGRGEDEGEGRPPANYCVAISNPKFQENMKKFAETPIPADFATPEREAKKTELVKVFEELKADCGKKANQKAQDAKVDRIVQLWNEIQKIPNQTKPAGDWAKE